MRGGWFPLAAILLLALNLRPVATSVGPVLGRIATDLAMPGAVAGALTSLPALCFSIFGAAAPSLARRFGPHQVIAVALTLLTVGQLGRAWVGSAWPFLLLSIMALAGMALANVLLPSLVRWHFPHRVGLATSLYSLSMTIGVTAASVGTVPLAYALGGWRAAFTAATVIAVAALVCWLPLLRGQPRPQTTTASRTHLRVLAIARTPMGWAMAVLFGIQSAQAYTIFGWLPTIYLDAGMTDTNAGLMLGIATGVGIVPSFLIPAWTDRNPTPTPLFLVIMGFLVAGYLGLMVAPMTLPWLWAVFLALGTASFPLILALFGLRARTAAGTAALSGFTQSLGYLIAACGPFAVGLLHARTADWHLVLGIQAALSIPMTIAGVTVTRRVWYIEDEVARG